jgi:predicted transcriptional regulator
MTVQWHRMAVEMCHPTQVAIMQMLDVEPMMSPKQMAQRLDRPLGQVSYHVRLLHAAGLLKLVGQVTRRGALEHFYALSNRRGLPAIDPVEEIGG